MLLPQYFSFKYVAPVQRARRCSSCYTPAYLLQRQAWGDMWSSPEKEKLGIYLYRGVCRRARVLLCGVKKKSFFFVCLGPIFSFPAGEFSSLAEGLYPTISAMVPNNIDHCAHAIAGYWGCPSGVDFHGEGVISAFVVGFWGGGRSSSQVGEGASSEKKKQVHPPPTLVCLTIR